jgi:hypothetical protein
VRISWNVNGGAKPKKGSVSSERAPADGTSAACPPRTMISARPASRATTFCAT